MEERVRAVGHANVSASHASTFEVTADDFLTPAGDCILAVAADRTPADFRGPFVDACQDRDARITAELRVAGRVVTVTGRGHPTLTFADGTAIVGRTSEYVDDRTVMIDADAAAGDLPRPLIGALADGAALDLRLRVDR